MKRKGLVPLLLGTLLVSVAFKTIERRVVKRSMFNSELTGTPYIIVDKSDYELQVFDDDGWYATYPAVFGSKTLEDKMMEGDRKTPEGTYKIVTKKLHDKWDKMMLIDYPTKADMAKFNERKAKGLIPKNAKIGNGIAIHGTWQKDDMAVDYFQNWTNGCVALKRPDMTELYEIIPLHTKVIIKR